MSQTSHCPECGAELPSSAPRGLCPACLLKRGLESNTVGYTESPAVGWTPPTVEELAGRFPELEIQRLIGRGGMGAVYQARQKNLDRTVALKILPPQMISRDPAFAAHFAQEAKSLAKLSHPHIVTIHEFGERERLYYFVMEYVDGVSLRGLLDAGHISPQEALAIVPQICDALQYAHDQGIVHRDIKPENILLSKQGQVKIADFGLAKLMGKASPVSEKVMGTPLYMAPEQLERPAEVDHRADIYSLGAVFYQMLTGELPKSVLEPPSRKVRIDVRLDEVVLRAMEREPSLRYQQASEVKTEVETIAQMHAPVNVVHSTAFGWEYRSRRTLGGLPLIHVAMGIDPVTGKGRSAQGIIAVGQTAKGVIATGSQAYGVIAFGGFAAGLLALGGFSVGLLSFGGFAFALLYAYGGLAIAPVAFGGLALGYCCFGGYAMGVHALGSNANDPYASEFFASLRPNWLTAMFFVLFGGVMCLYGTLILLGRRWSGTRYSPYNYSPESGNSGGQKAMESSHYWFRAKRYGWGWGLPTTWEGWLFFLVWFLSTGIGTSWLAGHIHFAYAFLSLMVTVLLVICFAKGEPLRWRWGKEEGSRLASTAVDPAVRLRDRRLAIMLTTLVALAGLVAALLGSLGEKLAGMQNIDRASSSQDVSASARPDNIDLPFINDSAVIGTWQSVDLVANTSEFDPDTRRWQGELYLKELAFLENGQTLHPWWTWTKGFLIHHGDKTASRYEIRQINGQSYLFLEWKSGDVMIRGMKPHYYVLRKNSAATPTTRAAITRDRLEVEMLGTQMLVAIRSDKGDTALKNLAADRIRGWRNALPIFAKEMRQQFQRMTGKSFDMHVSESLIDSDWAAVRCDGPAELKGDCLILFFVKTPDGWRNYSLHNAPPGTSLEKQIQSTAPPCVCPARPSPSSSNWPRGISRPRPGHLTSRCSRPCPPPNSPSFGNNSAMPEASTSATATHRRPSSSANTSRFTCRACGKRTRLI